MAILLVMMFLAHGRLFAFQPAPLAISPDRPISGFGFRDAFPPHRFEQPVAVVSAPGETNRVFVVERKGIIWAITNLSQPTRSVFLDLNAKTIWNLDYNETGMLGLAFHPGFATNGYFFVYRTYYNISYFNNTLSRFRAPPAQSDRAEAESEEVLFAQSDISTVHNAGNLHFGPDGYLYFSVGFDGPVLENPERTQTIDAGMFGGIFRIDVDRRPESLEANPHPSVTPGAYKIPPDNPFVGATTFLGAPVDPGKVRTEYYATGLRNPWQFSIDPETAEIFCGDVGEMTFEEVNLIEAGKNYGHPFFEGNAQRIENLPDVPFASPLHFYPHGMATNQGTAAIGGYVVRNNRYPNLNGAYVFGDFGSGNVWKLRRGTEVSVEWIAREPGLAAFGTDPSNGDLLVINVGEGTIRRLVYSGRVERAVPSRLSETRVFTDLSTLTIAPGYEPFEINVPFWSDGARKQRWFGLSDPQSRFGFVEDGNWVLPKGAVWIKHFELELIKGDPSSARRLETRILLKSDHEIHGYSYRWGNSLTEAQLVSNAGMDESFEITDGATRRTQVWHYPGSGECHACHSRSGGFAAGFNTVQLNREATHQGVARNELQRLVDLGYLDREVIEPSKMRKLAPAADQTQPLEHRAKSFLAANCAMCHRPDGLPIKARWDARISTPLEEANIIDGPISQGFNNSIVERVVRRRDITNSVMMLRMQYFHPWTYHMPPFASTVVNDEAINLLKDWINTMPEPEWVHGQAGASLPLFGSVAERATTMTVSGTGGGIHQLGEESFYWVRRPLSNNFAITARLKNTSGPVPGLQGGLMVRPSGGASEAYVALLQDASGRNTFVSRRANDPTIHQIVGGAGTWQKLEGNAGQIRAWERADDGSWTLIATEDLELGSELSGGFAVASGDTWSYATVEFQNYSMISAGLETDGTEYLLPTTIPLNANVFGIGTGIQRVQLYAGDRLIASLMQPPWRVDWTNALSGEVDLRAVVFGAGGLSVTSAPVAMTLTSRPSSAFYYGSKPLASSNWRDDYGKLGFALPLLRTNFPAGSEVTTQGAGMETWAPPIFGLDDLAHGIIASAWSAPREFSLTFNPAFEDPYRLTVCLSDYENKGMSVEIALLSPEGKILDQRIGGGLSPLYCVTWSARGRIQVRLRSLNSFPVNLSAIFLDPVPTPQITLKSPGADTVFMLPTTIDLQTEAFADGRPLQRVDFFSNGHLVGSDYEPPYEFAWTNALAGENVLCGVAVGFFGINATSAPVTIRCELPPTRAIFAGQNGTIQGDWWRAFGADGYKTPLGMDQLRSFARVSIEPVTDVWTWNSGESDERGTWQDVDSYLATCWHYPGTLAVNVDLLDGREHSLAFYFLDFDRVGAAEHVRLINADTQEVFNEFALDDLGGGLYLAWNAQGRVRLEIARLSDWNSVLSGIFVGPRIRASQYWWARNFGADLLAIPKWNEDPDHDGRPNAVEYAFGSNPLATDEPFQLAPLIDGDSLVVSATGRQLRFEVHLSLETSVDLVNWSESGAERADSDSEIRYVAPLVSGETHYYRLRVDGP